MKDSTTYNVEIKQHTDEKFGDVTKNGWFLGNDWQPKRAHWTIDFNKGLNDIENPVLKDNLYHADSQYSMAESSKKARKKLIRKNMKSSSLPMA